MSMSKYFKNCILFGDVESHCLICKETFQCESQIEKHIRWDKHRNSVKAQSYVPKLKKDFISKFDNNYYCEICNYCTQDIKIITNHINDEVHKTNKKDPEKVNKTFIGKHEKGCVVIENTKITNTQWNGIIGEECVICSTNISDIAKHVTSQEHIINLIQTGTKRVNNQYYRQVKENYFQCFSCKNIFPDNVFTDHWTSVVHTGYVDKTTINTSSEPQEVYQMERLISQARNALLETQKDYFNIDIVNGVSTCKTCTETCSLVLKEMLMHLKLRHSDMITKDLLFDQYKLSRNLRTELCIDHGKRRSELAIYGKENYIKLSEGAQRSYCWLCDVTLVPNGNIFREHINGAFHKSHILLKRGTEIFNEKEQYYKLTTWNRYIKNLNFCKDLSSFLINADYFVNHLSFFFLLRIDYNPRNLHIKCHACDIVFVPQGILNHCKTKQHAEYVMSSKILDVKDEFIREIKPKKYHCGACNQVFSYSHTLEKHLRSVKHSTNKIDSNPIMCFDMFHKLKGWVPVTEQISLSSNSELMYLSFIEYGIVCFLQH